MDVYAILTEKIINLLEQGIVPWRRPWTGTGLPRNLVSIKPYRGLNYFLLSASKYISPYWLTMRQVNELGGHVRRDEESTAIVFWKVDDARDDVEDAGVNERNVKTRRRFLLRYYRVWNLEQCELPAKVLDKLPTIETHQHIRLRRQTASSQKCRIRPGLSIADRWHSTAPARIASLCPRTSFSLVPLSCIARPTTNLSTAQGARKGLREKDSARRPRSVRQSIPKKNCAPSSEPRICVPKPESPMQSLTTRQPTYPDGYRGCARIASY